MRSFTRRYERTPGGELTSLIGFEPVRIRQLTVDQRRRASLMTATVGAGCGAGLTYFLDATNGRRRRALVTDKAGHLLRAANKGADTTGRDLRNRVTGWQARARSRVRRDRPDDRQLVERVRAALGLVSNHPRAISVTAENGVVTIAGPILGEEADRVESAVAAVRGVRAVINHLDPHAEPGRISALQGEGAERRGPVPELLQESWSPSARLFTSATGGALGAWGLRHGGVRGWVAGMAGGLLFSRAIANMPVRRLVGIGAGRQAVELDKTIEVAARVEDVWRLWDDYTNFPRFMSHVREVRTDDGRSHWKVDGPAGRPVTFDAELTRREPNEALAWRSCDGSLVAHSGVVRLEPAGTERTRVHVHLAYNPIFGLAAHGAATLLGANPKRLLDDDLLRMKTLLETGTPAHDAAQPAG